LLVNIFYYRLNEINGEIYRFNMIIDVLYENIVLYDKLGTYIDSMIMYLRILLRGELLRREQGGFLRDKCDFIKIL